MRRASSLITRKLVAALGVELRRLSDDEIRFLNFPYDESGPPISAEEAATLRWDNPALSELRVAYEQLNIPVVNHSIWADTVLRDELQMPWFRGDNAYVWQYRQLRSEVRMKIYLMLLYARSQDRLRLLEKLVEDGAFGCWRFSYGNNPSVSRELLDSIIELNFLDNQLKLSQVRDLRILDIGAGYGRLAYRACESLKNLTCYDCVDGVAESTFLCDFYLRYRGVEDRARSVPLHRLDEYIDGCSYHLAVNIYSFSECTLAAIEWWLSKIIALRIPYLLVIPNEANDMLSTETDGSRLDYRISIENRGYSLRCKQPIYNDAELAELIGVRNQFYLFELQQ